MRLCKKKKIRHSTHPAASCYSAGELWGVWGLSKENARYHAVFGGCMSNYIFRNVCQPCLGVYIYRSKQAWGSGINYQEDYQGATAAFLLFPKHIIFLCILFFIYFFLHPGSTQWGSNQQLQNLRYEMLQWLLTAKIFLSWQHALVVEADKHGNSAAWFQVTQ